MPSTLPPLDASSEWGRQSEPAVHVPAESDPAGQVLPRFGPSHSQPLLPGHAGSGPECDMAGAQRSMPMDEQPPSLAAGQSGIRPQVAPELWVAPEDVWNTSSFKALIGAGTRPAARPTRPLPRPERFRPIPRWRSYLYLGVLLVTIAIVAVGSIQITSLAKDVFGQPAPTAQPAPTHTATPLHTTPTTKPRQ